MKNIVKMLLLTAVLAAGLCVTAFAASDPGMKNVTVASGFTSTVQVTPQTATGTAVTPVDGFYANAEKMAVKYTGANAGSFYLVLALSDSSGVPTEDNMVYIDQDSATSNSVSFTVFPSELVSGTTYCLYLSSNSSGDISGLTQVASFQYYADESYKLGDVDESGALSATDALWTLQAVAGNRSLSSNQFLAADADKSGSLSATDALYILQAVAGNRVLK